MPTGRVLVRRKRLPEPEPPSQTPCHAPMALRPLLLCLLLSFLAFVLLQQPELFSPALAPAASALAPPAPEQPPPLDPPLALTPRAASKPSLRQPLRPVSPASAGGGQHACTAVLSPDPAAPPPSVGILVAGAVWEADTAPQALLHRLRGAVLGALDSQRPSGGLALLLCTPPGAPSQAAVAALRAGALPGVAAAHVCAGEQARTAVPLHSRAAACALALDASPAPGASTQHWQWLLLMRPDLNFFAPAPLLSALSPRAVHARLRALWPGRAPAHTRFTAAHFAYLWGSPRCWEDRLPSHAAQRFELYDDQLAVVPRAHIPLMLGLQASLQRARAAQCLPHEYFSLPPFTTPAAPGDWGEVDFTLAVQCAGVGLVPLQWEARLIKFAGYGPCHDAPCPWDAKDCSLGRRE